MKLREALIRLAHSKPELQEELLPLLKKQANMEDRLFDTRLVLGEMLREVSVHLERGVEPRTRVHGALTAVEKHLKKADDDLRSAAKLLSRQNLVL